MFNLQIPLVPDMRYRDPKKNYDLFSALSKCREQSQREIGIFSYKA